MRFYLAIFLLFSTPAFAELSRAIDLSKKHYADFSAAANELHAQSMQDCRAPALIIPYHRAFDAWVMASTTSFGPIDDIGGPLAVSFWPDKKGFTRKAITQLIAKADQEQLVHDQFAELSIASTGFMALDQLLFDKSHNGFDQDAYECLLVQAITRDMKHKAGLMSHKWQTDFADELKTAGTSDTTRFLSKDEVAQAYLTALTGALEFANIARLARPIGSIEKPRPKRAEGWRSNRPLRNIKVSLETVLEIANALSINLFHSEIALRRALNFIPEINSSDFQSLGETSVLFQVTSLQQMIIDAQEALNTELSLALGVSSGFNALDGD